MTYGEAIVSRPACSGCWKPTHPARATRSTSTSRSSGGTRRPLQSLVTSPPCRCRGVTSCTCSSATFSVPYLINWEPNARFVLGAFRASTSTHVNEAWFQDLVSDLSHRSDEFRRWWQEYALELRPVAYKELNHPVVGRLMLEQTALLLDDSSGRRLILYTPQPGTGTETKLRELAKQS